jgi:putative redox protein
MSITSRLTSRFRFESVVRGHTVVVDQPTGSGGGDEGPTPPELLAISLGTCVGVYAIYFCEKHNISTEGLVIHTDYEKVAAPTRIGKLACSIELPAGIPAEKYEAFMKNVEGCLIHNTLHHSPEVTLTLAGAPVAMGACGCTDCGCGK